MPLPSCPIGGMADTGDLKSPPRKGVEVRLLYGAPEDTRRER